MRIELPDWRKWLADRTKDVARQPEDYDLHLAAVEWSLASALDINSREDFLSLPSPNVEPFVHQVDDAIVYFRRLQPRGLIADDVGLGKTVTAGLIARELLERGLIESILIVCPKGLLDQWKEELSSKFGIEAVTAVGSDFRNLDRQRFWITTYQTARGRIAEIKRRKFDLAILDEAHALRNLFGSNGPPKVATMFHQLMKDGSIRYCLMLTATPIQNRLWDIFSLGEVLASPQPNPLGRPDEFRRKFIADPDARVLRPGTTEEFRNRIAQAMVRKRRGDTNLLFPTREVKDQRLEPLPGEKEFIERALQVILKFPPLVQITHARTLMSSPWAAAAAFEREAQKPHHSPEFRTALLQLAGEGRAIKDSAKVQAVVRLASATAKDGQSGRLIVFTQRVETLRHLSEALAAAGFGDQVATMQGSESGANLQSIHDFMSEPARRPILLSTDVGAVGLNLQAGNIVVNYDLPWNPMVVEQRIGRVQRLGQKANKVIVYNLVLKGTIEDHVVLRLMEKLNLFTQAIGEMEELLELCGYDEEHRSLEQIIMELVRKAAEKKDIDEDLRLMDVSRRQAEEKIREMREANEKAFASIRPRDTGDRLEGLQKVTPRLPLGDLVRSCLRRAGAHFREDPDGRVFIRVPDGFAELVFDRNARPAPGQNIRLATPGTRAFEHLTKDVREKVAHQIADARNLTLDKVVETLTVRLRVLGMLLEAVKPIDRRPAVAIRLAVKLKVEIPTDRYETLVEIDHIPSDHGIEPFPQSAAEWKRVDGTALPICESSQPDETAPALELLEPKVSEVVQGNESVARFCKFYDHRYRQDLAALASHAETLGYRRTGTEDESFVEYVASRDSAVQAALKALQYRFSPTFHVDPVGISGIRYESVAIEAAVRHRRQREASALTLWTVPLTGIVQSPIPGADSIREGEEAWACPGGHIVEEQKFARCRVPECTAGACEDCLFKTPDSMPLSTCTECGSRRCPIHTASCAECARLLCVEHLVKSAGSGPRVCSGCTTTLDDGEVVAKSEVEVSAVSGRRGARGKMAPSPISGEWAFPDEFVKCEESGRELLPGDTEVCSITKRRVAKNLVATSEVSGRPALRRLMVKSDLSNRLCLPGEEAICDETGAVLLPDETGICGLTGRHVRKDLLGEDAITGTPALRKLLTKSTVAGELGRSDRMAQSEKSGRIGLPSEVETCGRCEKRLLTDEIRTCPETGQRACPEHFEECESSHEAVLPEGLGICEVSGRRIRRSLLARCPESGKTAALDLFDTCQVTETKVLPSSLEFCAVTGKRVRASLLDSCQETGRRALPQALQSCAVTGKRVLPDLLVTCPETGARFLPAHGVKCEETGETVTPAGLETCIATGNRARLSLLSRDDLSGDRILTRLLDTCEISKKRTLAEHLAVSSISGKKALPELVVRCAETGRVALPGELETCAATGKLVVPSLLITCPETGRRLLPASAQRCEATGELVAVEGLVPCEATGKRVRKSLTANDEVSGKRVLASLLRPCERTGKKTLPGNLVRSAASGKLILAEIADHCAVSGAPALAEELESCEKTGKRVLPSLITSCEISKKKALRDLLTTCELTGKKVLPEFVTRCSRSGRSGLTTSMGISQLSGERGDPALLVGCAATGRNIFPDESFASQISGKMFAKDRLAICPICGRLADVSELARCGVCAQRVCPEERLGGTCTSCVRTLTKSGGRAMTVEEVSAIRQLRPWARRGWVVESAALSHAAIETGTFDLPRRAILLVLRKEGGSSPFDGALRTPVHERKLEKSLIQRTARLLGASAD